MKHWRNNPTRHTWNGRFNSPALGKGKVFFHLVIECFFLLAHTKKPTLTYGLCTRQALRVCVLRRSSQHFKSLLFQIRNISLSLLSIFKESIGILRCYTSEYHLFELMNAWQAVWKLMSVPIICWSLKWHQFDRTWLLLFLQNGIFFSQ
jgi:hypothetical protein